jgi:hypothetical protein
VPDFAAVVTLPFELSSGIATRIAVAITRPVFLGTLISSIPLLLTVVTGFMLIGRCPDTTGRPTKSARQTAVQTQT